MSLATRVVHLLDTTDVCIYIYIYIVRMWIAYLQNRGDAEWVQPDTAAANQCRPVRRSISGSALKLCTNRRTLRHSVTPRALRFRGKTKSEKAIPKKSCLGAHSRRYIILLQRTSTKILCTITTIPRLPLGYRDRDCGVYTDDVRNPAQSTRQGKRRPPKNRIIR